MAHPQTSKASSSILPNSHLGVGGYVVSGFGIERSVSSTQSRSHGSSTSLARSKSQGANASSPISGNFSKPTRLLSNITSTPTIAATSLEQNFTGNHTVPVAQCWSQWSTFWSVNDSWNSAVDTTLSGDKSTTITLTHLMTVSTVVGPETSTATYTADASNGFQTITTVATMAECTASQGCTYSQLVTYEASGELYYEASDFLLPTPHCTLPSRVSQCQSQWDFYESGRMSLFSFNAVPPPACPQGENSACVRSGDAWGSTSAFLNAKPGTEPSCTQASLATSFCGLLGDEYISTWLHSDQGAWYTQRESAGYVQTSTTFPNGSQASVQIWPSTSSLGPGCSLGCARCAITGGAVQLFYWPTTQTVNGTNGTVPVIASASGTLLTSPTVYISFASIYASDSCRRVGSTYGATILPVANPSAISSVWNDWPDFENPRTAVFNYTDLNAPIPDSIYVRQPQCAADQSQLSSWSFTLTSS